MLPYPCRLCRRDRSPHHPLTSEARLLAKANGQDQNRRAGAHQTCGAMIGFIGLQPLVCTIIPQNNLARLPRERGFVIKAGPGTRPAPSIRPHFAGIAGHSGEIRSSGIPPLRCGAGSCPVAVDDVAIPVSTRSKKRRSADSAVPGLPTPMASVRVRCGAKKARPKPGSE